MVNWKLIRHLYGNEEYTLIDGENITVGRGYQNKIILTSSVVSRNHCVISVKNNNISIKDLQSSNGVYIGNMKIQPNTSYCIDDSTLIGIGWTIDASFPNIQDTEKYVFRLVKENRPEALTSRFEYQSDNELDHIKKHIAESCSSITTQSVPTERQIQESSHIIGNKLSLKRKTDNYLNIDKIVPKNNPFISRAVIVISDSDNENHVNSTEFSPKKPKCGPISEESHKLFKDDCVKTEHEVEYEAFNVKQEYFGYNDEPIQIDSESDSESEQWLLRLSQSSPGNPFTKIVKKSKLDIKQEENSYSQLDDFVCDEIEDEEYMDDIISIPPKPCDVKIDVKKNLSKQQPQPNESEISEDAEFCDDIITIIKPSTPIKIVDAGNKDHIGSFICEKKQNEPEKVLKVPNDAIKKVRIIEPLVQLPKGKSCQVVIEGTSKDSSKKHKKVQKRSSKRHITISQKEERKKKLKEIAIKEKDSEEKHAKDSANSSVKPINNIKITSSNRGAFLTGVIEPVAKPTNKAHKTSMNTKPLSVVEKKQEHEKSNKDKHNETKYKCHSRTETKSKINKTAKENETRVPLKFLKPLTDCKESSGKPLSKVGPLQPDKFKKKVHFSDSSPQVRVFQIEPGNKMKKTSLVKTTLVDVRQKPIFSLDKITLMKILRWNPQWLEEQMNYNDPPPILGHNNIPMTIFHSFVNHNQYVQLIGDLLLMEIWECLTIPYMRTRNHNNYSLQMRIESLPPAPLHEHCFDLFSFSVNVSLPSVEARNVPRVGEILLVAFGPDNAKNQRFFYVNNVRTLPSPSSNKNSFFSISLQVTFTDKMRLLKPGELIIGRSLAYINNELMLFEAMEYLAGSPLSNIILKPEPYHFINEDNQNFDLKSQWTATLNSSQLAAVSASVTAALGDKPCIKMVQGPPGTGKSSVICAIVMAYFYNARGKKHQNRGKILICATSNAAVDGLAIKLLNLRQSLPKPERFRMVRVGREEAMHPTASNVSSQQLAQRELARVLTPHDHAAPPTAHPGFDDEILHLEAKINMWKTAAQNAQDPVRVAYCQGRVADLVKRITLMREGRGAGSERAGRGQPRPEQLTAAERRIIEGADIIVTTLASAQNHKMRGLKRRIALCIIDEAGQAIEPETLIPLTLDVTKLTLVGDPQQLPGFICSQRAKKHGLSESLFSRLASYTENWSEGSPVVLLNQQYRMHPDIIDYPSRAFYDGRIQSLAPPRPDLPIPPYAIISISSGDRGQGMSGANEMEAWGVSRLVVALENVLRTHNMKLAVITPYNGHKELIKKNIRLLQHHRDAAQVEVNTVDSFQGQERDVVVVSLARSQGVGFLTDTGRMNVMLTRARHALLICLNPHALLKNPQWRTLVEDAQRRNLYRIFPNRVCQPPNSRQEPADDILKYLV